ncbi:hypothetical protein ACFWU5_01910 [Nocardia sp. NPDC058640]|uniref:hypothetical protein n=1 Tax=Nocardia sp. NPDC058640 TaxID=3346571 RepID=UPI0036617E48
MTSEVPNLDYGQAEIAAFLEGARNGQFSFQREAVIEMVGKYDLLVNTLLAVREQLEGAASTKGFGGLQSAVELQDGFSRKATDGASVLDQAIEGVLDIQEGYLRAADLFPEIDALNQKRINLAATSIDGQS